MIRPISEFLTPEPILKTLFGSSTEMELMERSIFWSFELRVESRVALFFREFNAREGERETLDMQQQRYKYDRLDRRERGERRTNERSGEQAS